MKLSTYDISCYFYADIELHSKCLDVVLAPLRRLSHTGFKCDSYTLYPLFYSYVHDYPEGSKVSDFCCWYFICCLDRHGF